MEQPEKAEKITVGKVTVRKKPLGRRFAETFLGGDAKSTFGFVVAEVVLPAIKDAVVDAGSQFIERLVFGDSRGGSRPRSRWGGTSTYTPYNNFSATTARPTTNYQTAQPQRAVSRQARAAHDFNEIILSSRAEAMAVIDKLMDRVAKYEQATVGDLYDIVGISVDFTDEKYGWTDLQQAGVRRLRSDQYLLDLPAPIQLD